MSATKTCDFCRLTQEMLEGLIAQGKTPKVCRRCKRYTKEVTAAHHWHYYSRFYCKKCSPEFYP